MVLVCDSLPQPLPVSSPLKEGFCPLASGSKGNCLYLGTSKTKILIDAGLSGRATQQRLAQIGIHLEEIRAIVISHEHTDHIQGLKTLAFKYKIPILANIETAKGIRAALGASPQFKIFSTGEPFIFEGVEIHPFSVPHDTADPVGFTFRIDGLCVGVCTDLGHASQAVQNHLRVSQCDFLFIEANHEPHMVHASSRPMIYKQRVLGYHGHLSNEACGVLVQQILHPGLRHVQLAHLSQECNTPHTALQVVARHLPQDLPLSVAPQETLGTPFVFA